MLNTHMNETFGGPHLFVASPDLDGQEYPRAIVVLEFYKLCKGQGPSQVGSGHAAHGVLEFFSLMRPQEG